MSPTLFQKRSCLLAVGVSSIVSLRHTMGCSVFHVPLALICQDFFIVILIWSTVKKNTLFRLFSEKEDFSLLYDPYVYT